MSSEATASADSTGITLRAVKTQDRDFLLAVYAGTREEELALTGWDDAERSAFVAQQFTAQNADYDKRFPGSDHRIVSVDGVDVGRMWVASWDNEMRLLDIALLAEHRNQGIGTFLLRRLQDQAAAAGKHLRHSVYKMNVAGLRLYTRLQFQVVQDLETHVLMEWVPPERTARPVIELPSNG